MSDRNGQLSDRPKTSTRDLQQIVSALAPWLTQKVSADAEAVLGNLQQPTGAGMSSETLLFEATWTKCREPRTGSFVLRLPPPAEAFPLFPWYDMERQVSAMRFVRDQSATPVPAVPWFEDDECVLGAPFFIMEQVAGVGVPDMPPYVFGSWVTETDDRGLREMRSGLVDLLVSIHGIDDDLAHWELDEPGETALARHVAHQRRYYDWIRNDLRFPLIEEAFRWLEDRWPSNAGDAVLSWGDARIANVLWQDLQPVAALDWEAVAVGPRELDLGWLLYFLEYFQRIAERYGHPGAPGLVDRAEMVRAYAERSGHVPQDIEWYLVYAELRQALTSIRVTSRAVHFGERPVPDDPQDLIGDPSHLREVLQT